MEFIMVNSSSLGSEKNGDTKISFIQTNVLLHSKSQLSSPPTAASAVLSKNELANFASEKSVNSIDTDSLSTSGSSKEPLADNFDLRSSSNNEETNETKTSLFCSVPLEKVQTVLSGYTSSRFNGMKMKISRKIMCLYCDRTFVNANLKQKHVERCHSTKQLRRVSLRKHQNLLTSTPCIYCDKFTSTEHTLKDLFKHLIENHSHKYFGCLACEERFLNSTHLSDHNGIHHSSLTSQKDDVTVENGKLLKSVEKEEAQEATTPVKITRKKYKTKKDNNSVIKEPPEVTNFEQPVNNVNMKNLRSRKLTVKSSRMILKRSKRLQAKLNQTSKKRTKEITEKKKNDRQEQIFNTKSNEKPIKTNFINPYPEFDNFFQVKKITDHSIDNLKIGSLTFDDVFDKAFFNRIKSNIQENLLHHIDGKLFKNEESESRISNFEKNIPQEPQTLSTENYGCELSLNAVTPTTLTLSNHFGDDPESQIEYGSKPSKKKTQLKKDEVHYKYFTRRKYQASILEHKENRDLSKLDMWTQYIVKNRQQKILEEKKSPKEMLDYFSSEEYKSIMKREELNRILDRRGPFEDLIEEVNKKAALDKLNGDNSPTDDDNFAVIGELLNDILNKVFDLVNESSSVEILNKSATHVENVVPEIPSYLNLRPSTEVTLDNEIDRSDKITLICSSQETENFELPGNTVRGKNEKVELTGEWARSRIYVCAACGLKLQNIKQFLEHKSASHQYIWVQHYEFVGNQSELYRHLSIPILGKVGVLENTVQCKIWKRSDARLCTKCSKQCNSLGELHRHILECGGDWTWMLVRKKYKYRPFGAKSRRKRRGLVKRIYTQKTEPGEKKVYKKSFDLPRQKPSDADTIKRMLANLPPKRATRKIICLKDGFSNSRSNQVKTKSQSKFKCGKRVKGKTKGQKKTDTVEYEKSAKNQNNTYRRSLRSLNKVLSSRIMDTNASLVVKRKRARKVQNEKKNPSDIVVNKKQNNIKNSQMELKPSKISPRNVSKNNATEQANVKKDFTPKRSSLRIERRIEHNGLVEKMNIKRFFPVKKKKKDVFPESKKNVLSNEIDNDSANSKTKNELEINLPVPSSQETDSNRINLRKRKLDSKITEPDKQKVKKNRKKTQKLKNNSTNSTDSVPLQTDCVVTPEHQDQNDISNFFEKDQGADSFKKKVSPVDREDVEKNELNNSDFFEEDVKREEANLEEPISSQKEKKPDTPTPVAQEVKRKVRKPRGLNDCIAMLTSKLNKNLQESIKVNVFHDVSNNEVQKPTDNMENISKNSNLILKVPFSNEHFELSSTTKDNEHLAPEISKNNNLNGQKTKADEINTQLTDETQMLNCQISDNENSVEESRICFNVKSEENSLSKENGRRVENDLVEICETRPHKNNDSDDEIPLLTLLKDEQCDKTTSIKNCVNNCGSPKDMEIVSDEIELLQQNETKEENFEHSSECNNVEDMSHKLLNSNEDNSNESDTCKTKDITVLTEINDNLSQDKENLNHLPTTLENMNGLLNKKICDDIEDHSTQNKVVEKSPEDSVLSLENHFVKDIYSNLDKFKFFSEGEIDIAVSKPNEIQFIEPNASDLSEYKENSLTVVEVKHQSKKKSNTKGRTTEDNQDAKENEDSQVITDKKSPRTAKTKALESILDDALLELSENEIFMESSRNIPCEINLQNDKKLPKKHKNICSSKNKVDEVSINSPVPLEDSKDCSQKLVEDQILNDDEKSTKNSKELRRSMRNSKKVTSYNETDLVDPLFDDIDSEKTISKLLKETTKDIFGIKRKNRKKTVKDCHDDGKVNGDELFDLLKETPTENIVLSKPTTNSIFNTFDEISNDFNDDNFDVLGDILEKSMAVIEENLSDQTVSNSTSNFSEFGKQFTEQVSRLTEATSTEKNSKLQKPKSRKGKQRNKKSSFCKIFTDDQQPLKEEDKINNPTVISEISQETKIVEDDKVRTVYCEICEKSFSRVESLTKHRRTLTHISKLSELEAKEAALRNKASDVEQLNANEESETNHSSDSRRDNVLTMLSNEEESTVFEINDSDLKLADIINDVLNKPTFEKTSIQDSNEGQPEVRRYKSLAERKSFESENCIINVKTNCHVKSSEYFEPEIINGAAGTILEKQISILENIIENHASLNYIEELSVSSTQSLNQKSSENELIVDTSEQSDQREKHNGDKITFEENLLKRTTFEEVSEDSNLKNFEEQKSRKVLNRDEELFLECCSLLKSGSEVSSYSKKSNNLGKESNNIHGIRSIEPDWLDNNCLSQKENEEYVEYLSDSSRGGTPFEDNFSHGDSSSVTISSQWDTNNTKKTEFTECPELEKKLSFKEVFNNKNTDFLDDEQNKEWYAPISNFSDVVSEDLRTDSSAYVTLQKRNIIESETRNSDPTEDHKDATNTEGKKMLTKGALKVFEGLKVSIPTEDLNMDKILTTGLRSSNSNISTDSTSIKAKEIKRNSDACSKSDIQMKISTKRSSNKNGKMDINSKVHDVYDFEETQDNSDVFTRPDFKSYRSNYEKHRKSEKTDMSDDDSQDCNEAISFDGLSSSTSSVSEIPLPKPRTQQNITKKKCMIMGRIFKNAAKSKTVDEDIRNIPVIDNTKLVENFVLNCPGPVTERKPRMTEEEMNLAFDNLLNGKASESKTSVSEKSSSQKSNSNKRRLKVKSRKRSHRKSESSDDEFRLQNSTKKRPKKKNNGTEDSCINLEQELRECIGVASRKSQRKCTSGKQNVLIEYWSSDESSSETIVEKPPAEDFIQKEDSNEPSEDSIPDSNLREIEKFTVDVPPQEDSSEKKSKFQSSTSSNRRKRVAANPLYHWSSSSEDESRDLIEIRPIRDEIDDDEDRPVQHGWIVGDSPKKLVTMLAQAKGKKCEVDGVKEHGKKRTSTYS